MTESRLKNGEVRQGETADGRELAARINNAPRDRKRINQIVSARIPAEVEVPVPMDVRESIPRLALHR